MARYNLTFDLKSTSAVDLAKAVGDALTGNLDTAHRLGATMERASDIPAEIIPAPPNPSKEGREMTDWRPIESAPRDCIVLLHGTQQHQAAQGPLTFTGYWDATYEAWCSTGSTWTGPFYDPTHWRPVPAPPQAAAHHD